MILTGRRQVIFFVIVQMKQWTLRGSGDKVIHNLDRAEIGNSLCQDKNPAGSVKTKLSSAQAGCVSSFEIKRVRRFYLR
jgi:hypothetical protein